MAATTGTGQSTSYSQQIRAGLQSLLSGTFSGTLGQEKDVVNVCMAICQQESSMGQNLKGYYLGSVVQASPTVLNTSSSSATDYWFSSPVQAVAKSASAAQFQNLKDGLCAWGIMQVMGWNFIQGGSRKAGKQDLEGTPAASLVIAAGNSIQSVLGNPGNGNLGNVNNQLLAGLAILEAKWKIAKPSNGQWQIGNIVYPTRLACAIRGYIGLGNYDLGTGISSQNYVDNVMGGKYYQIANNGASSSTNTAVANSSSGSAPVIAQTGTGTVPGCTSS